LHLSLVLAIAIAVSAILGIALLALAVPGCHAGKGKERLWISQATKQDRINSSELNWVCNVTILQNASHFVHCPSSIIIFALA
jgi:hypothetical protein